MDVRFDAALDTLTAHSLLESAGLGAQSESLSVLLVEAAHQLAPLASACAPHGRAAWALSAGASAVAGLPGELLQWEAAVARIAVEWVAVSSYASDALFAPQVIDGVDSLVLVQGLLPDPMVGGLQLAWQDKLAVLNLTEPVANEATMQRQTEIALHACRDGEDEAQRTAACALHHIEAGRFPLALVSSDRALTRRVRAMLEGSGVPMRDENGWKLSTSAAAAQVMAVLKACAWNATTDAVLAWLKCSPTFATQVDALEAALRRDQVRDWRNAPGTPRILGDSGLAATCAEIEGLRNTLHGRHGLSRWLTALRSVLVSGGLWESLQADGAGLQVLAVLRLSDEEMPAFNALASESLWAQYRLDLSGFTRWANQALEGARFQPAYPEREEVVILPMSQMLGRPFAAVVLAGCDEVRLQPSVDPPGQWTAAQRLALGLSSREQLEAATRGAWQQALQTPLCDMLWRTSDDAGETLLPSPLVQLLQWEYPRQALAVDARSDRSLEAQPVARPLPSAAVLPLRTITQGAYEDLRQCPYRFFALRQLGLKSVDELESEVDKRDFGLWLHEVLHRFHASLVAHPDGDDAQRLSLLEAASADTTQAMALPEGEFLPFSASWPAVRDGYLKWLVSHEKAGFTFVSGETSQTQGLGDYQLKGRIDRIDRYNDGAGGHTLVLDYKTEAIGKTKARIKDALEDTQIAFYAALLPDDTLRGAYVNVSERGTEMVEQNDIVYARDALLHGMQDDLRRIAQGGALPALGEGVACDFCDARGLCRKDFWA
jgi:ATP-dependent helicase/nuclease subunit B